MTLFLLALAWLAGTVFAALGLSPGWVLVAFGGAGASLGLVLGGQARPAILAAVMAGIALLAIVRYESVRPPEAPYGIAVFNGGDKVAIRGTIVSDVDERERSQQFTLLAEAYRDGASWVPSSGRVLITTRLFPRYAYGDRLELEAKLSTPPELDGFDYRAYLARRGVVSLTAFPAIKRIGSGGGSDLLRLLGGVRRDLGDSLQRSLPEPEASLARGILLGQRAAIPADVTNDFNRSGISHLIAISGYNVMLVAGFAVSTLSWLVGRRRAVAASMGLVVLFAFFVGGSASVLRATAMAEVMLGAQLAGRPGSALSAVLLAGAVLTAWQPLIIDDVSFQLSFAATLGIVLLARPFQERLEAVFRRFPDSVVMPLAEGSALTLAATVAVQPVMASTFGRVSLVSLPANLLAVPAFPIVLLCSAVTSVVGSISHGAGRVVGDLAYLSLAYLVAVARRFSELPLASVSPGEVGTPEALLLYALVGVIAVLLLRFRGAQVEPRLQGAPRPALAALAVLIVLGAIVWRDVLSDAPQRLEVTVLDVGQGDAIVIETPSGRRVLVDGGPSGSLLAQALGRELSPSVRRFDLVVLTHVHDDHVTGLVSVLDRYQVSSVLMSPVETDTEAYRTWRAGLARHGVATRTAVAGEWVDLGQGVRLEVRSPPSGPPIGAADDVNDNSVVLRLVFGDISFLLTGDIEALGEESLVAAGGDLHASVLKLAHHGSDGSTSSPFLEAVLPRLAVISVGDNPYGHPSPGTQLRLAGIPFLRTDENGRIRFQTDGTSLWVDYDRGRFRIVPPGGY